MSRRLSLVVLSLIVVPMGAALAHDHHPPKSVLHVGGDSQRGKLGTYCWTSPGPEPDTYEQLCIEAIPDWPKAIVAHPSKKVVVRYHSPTEPQGLSIAYWRRVSDEGYPEGEAREIDASLKPYPRTGEEPEAWDLVFRLPGKGRHLYLHAAGYWMDRDGSGANQDASWTYHVRLLQPPQTCEVSVSGIGDAEEIFRSSLCRRQDRRLIFAFIDIEKERDPVDSE